MASLKDRAAAVGVVLGAVCVAVTFASALGRNDERARCGIGFVARAGRCLAPTAAECPAPLSPAPGGCVAPETRVLVPETTLVVGPSDWEAEGRIAARTIRLPAFRVDAFEVTAGRWRRGGGAPASDPARAASGMTRDEAAAFCASQGGRVPTEDEWMVAATSATHPPRRYPWGDTGAVCRRAAWGLADGPCARSGDGPDTVGAHGDGDSTLGLHDLAGNVAEWVAPEPGHADVGVAKGGSWRSSLATDLRIWARLELSPAAHDDRVGVRCVYAL